MINKIYLVKNLTPWMMDELLAFSYLTKFTVVFLRGPETFYQDALQKLEKNNVKIIIKPFNYNYKIKKIFFIFRFFFKHINKFLMGYSAVIGWKSLVWFFMLDLSVFQTPLSIHSQFATQASILSLMLKKYFNKNVEYSFTFHAYDIYFTNRWFTTLVNESQNSFSISEYNIKYVKDKYKNINYNKLKLSRLGVFSSKKIAIQSENKGDHILIGFLSWFVEKKGIKYLLDAIKTINLKYPNKFKFIFAGDGPLRNEILSFVKKNNLGNSFKYIGKIDGISKEEFFLSLDLFILPSIMIKNDMDGIPVVLMESISYGIPIISTNISGIPEICINSYNGILIEEKSSIQIVEAIIKLYSENELFVMSKNALKIYEEYDLIKNTKNKIELINW